MPSNENSLFTVTEGETTLATKEAWRRKKAEEQARDANGRWIADGARITYKDELSGKRVAATVVSTDSGDAIVLRDNPDGSSTRQKVPNNTVEVVSSKARLPKDGTEYFAKGEDFNPVLASKKFKDGLAKDGRGTITRSDGYQIDAVVDPLASVGDPEVNRKNPYSYQLFAPGGKSLGTYSSKATKSFNDMANEHKAGTPGGGSSESAEPSLFSGYTPVRVSRDGAYMIIKGAEGDYRTANMFTNTVSQPDQLSNLTKGRSWRKATRVDPIASLSSFTETVPDVMIASAEKVKPYRVPAAIKSEVSEALSTLSTSKLAPQDLATAQALASQDSVSLDEVKWIESFLSANEESKKLAGGPKGAQWASKILSGFADSTKHDFQSDKFSYFAVGDGQDGWKVNDLIAVDFATDEVYSWTDEGFSLSEKTADQIDEPVLMPIDEFSAESLSGWIDSGRDGGVFNLADIDPIERNLMELALSELDLAELEDIGAIVAAAAEPVVDVDGYTAAERSSNAQNQPRAVGGKFGTKREDPTPEAEAPVVKARLDVELPIITDTASHISKWLETAPVTAAAAPQQAPVAEEAPATPTETPAPAEAAPEAEAAPAAAGSGESKSLYFAIVDEVDKTAVLDVVAITKNDLSEPEAWKRSGATWVPAPELLAKFLGTTPPPVVNLEVPEPAKGVLAQIDTHDKESGVAAEAAPVEAAPAAEPLPVTASSGFTLDNGQWAIFSVQDLENAVSMFELTSESTRSVLKGHIRKRAFALNRMDLVPAEWRTPTLAERGEKFLSTSPLYGEHGEVILAAGAPGVADTPSDWAAAMRLQNYWTRGKGALKIRWGTPGDLTRAHKQLAKYVGPQRAWGLAQKYHKSLMGVYNHTHDVATGQYKPRRKKR